MKQKPGRSIYKLWTFLCSSGHTSRLFAWSYDESKPCSSCSQPSYRITHWTESSSPADKPMYFINSKGEVLFPGHKDDKPPKNFEIRHITSISDRDQFYKYMDQQIAREREQYIELEQQAYEADRSERRSEIRRMMEQGVPEHDERTGELTGRIRSMTEAEKDFCRDVMEENDRRGTFYDQPFPHTGNFHIEVFEMDKSNRRPHCDEQTNWRDRY